MLLPTSITSLRYSLISMGVEMTNSRYRKKRLGLVFFFFCTPVNEKLPQGSAAYVVVQNLEFYSWLWLHHASRVLFLLGELWFLTFSVFSVPTQRSTAPSSVPSMLQPTFLLHRWSTPQPTQDLTLHLTSTFTDTCWNEEQPLLPDKDNPLRLPPLEGSYRQALKILWSLTVD